MIGTRRLTVVSILFSALFALSLGIGVVCDSGGPSVGPSTSSYTVSIEPARDLIEAGESTYFTVNLINPNGARQDNALLYFSLMNRTNPGEAIGYLNLTQAYTDTINPRGMGTNVIFTSETEGTAVIVAEYRDGFGNLQDSASTEVRVEWSLHNLNLNVYNNQPNVGEQVQLFCIVFQGTQDAPRSVSGAQIHFEAYPPHQPDTPFGEFYPDYPATSDSTTSHGLTEPYYFWSEVEGACIIRAYYENALGEVAAEDTTNIVVGGANQLQL